MTGISKPAGSRLQSSLAYEVNYYPREHLILSKTHIKWTRSFTWSKADLLSKLDKQQTKLYHDAQWWKVHWDWNNVPTEVEWAKLKMHSTFVVELRISPLAENNGKIALIGMKQVFWDVSGKEGEL